MANWFGALVDNAPANFFAGYGVALASIAAFGAGGAVAGVLVGIGCGVVWLFWARPIPNPLVPSAALPALRRWGLDEAEGYVVAWSFFAGVVNADIPQLNELIAHAVASTTEARGRLERGEVD